MMSPVEDESPSLPPARTTAQYQFDVKPFPTDQNLNTNEEVKEYEVQMQFEEEVGEVIQAAAPIEETKVEPPFSRKNSLAVSETA